MVKMGDVWDRTVEFLGDRLGALLGVAILGIFVPLSILNALGGLWATAGMGEQLGLLAVSIALYVAIFWAYLAITATALDPAVASTSWSVAARRLPAGVGVYLILMAGIALLLMPVGALFGLSGIDAAAMQRGEAVAPAAPAMFWAGFLVLLVVLVALLVVSARLVPLTGVIVAERRGAGAIARAWTLTRGATWRLIGVLLLYLVVMQVAVLAAQTVFGSILRLFAGGEGAMSVAAIVTGIIVAAVQSGFSLLGAAFAAKLYQAIVRRAEAPAVAVTAAPGPWLA